MSDSSLPSFRTFLFAVFTHFPVDDCKTAHEADTCTNGPRSFTHLQPQLAASSFANGSLDGRMGAGEQEALIKSPFTWALGFQDFHPGTATFFSIVTEYKFP